jgi:hypothetical protein
VLKISPREKRGLLICQEENFLKNFERDKREEFNTLLTQYIVII